MNAVYDHFSHEEKNLIIEAETGMGKTIGVLISCKLLSYSKKPINRQYHVDFATESDIG